MVGDLLISVKEARKLLGEKSKKLTNEELEELISHTETVVRLAIRTYIGSKNSKNSAMMDKESTEQI